MNADSPSVLITGASTGIGHSTATRLSEAGWRVFAGVRDTTDARIGGVEVVELDVTSAESIAGALVHVSEQTGGRLDALVNNAGGQFRAPLEAISAKGWDAVVRTNLTGGFLVARECYLQWMKGAGAGSIVNIIADIWHGMPGMGHSGAARAGMLNFTETAALEWAPVRVNAVAPGWIASSGLDHYPAEMAAHIRALPQQVPLARWGTESEISAAIVFLLSDASAFTSGACLRVDGAVPSAKRVWPSVGTGQPTAAFEGFHLARRPKVLE
jgi:citronellol/citronellal dehydrogenase